MWKNNLVCGCVSGLMRWIAVVFAALCVTFGISSTGFAAEVNFSIDEAGRETDQRLEVGNNRVFLQAAGGDPSQDLLFDADNDVLYVIQHSDQSYLEIDDRVIDEVAALADSLSGAVESQQGVLSDLLTTFGVDSESRPKPAAMRKTERQLTIGGYSCQLFQAHLDGKMQSEMCVSPNSVLNLPAADFDTLYDFVRFGSRMMNRAGRLLDILGLTLPPMQLSATDGLPVGMHSPGQQLKVMLKSIKPSAGAPTNHNVPAGYSRSAIPFTSG